MTIARSILGERSSGRRKVFALAALLLFLLVVRLIWGAWSGRKANAALSALRARGEAVEAADVVYADVPDEENAWEAQKKALQGLTLTSPRHGSMEFPDYPPYPAPWMGMAAGSESRNPTAFAAVRAARQLSRVQFRRGLTSPVTAMLLTHLNGVRALANTIADGIAFAQDRRRRRGRRA